MIFIFMLFRKYFLIYETLYYLVDPIGEAVKRIFIEFHSFSEELFIMSVSFSKKSKLVKNRNISK